MMALQRKSILKNQKRPITRFGSRSLSWRKFRSEKAKKDRDEEGLIKCECWKLGFKSCGISRDSKHMELHHMEGRDGKLLLDESKMAWLIDECHDKAHNRNSSGTSSKAKDDSIRCLEETASSDAIPPIQRRPSATHPWRIGSAVRHNLHDTNAKVMVPGKEGGNGW